MTGTPAGGEPAESESKFINALRGVLLGGGLLFLVIAGLVPLRWPQQAVFGGVLIVLASVLNRGPRSYLATLSLMLLSCYVTFRYAFWRLHTLVHFFREPGVGWTGLDAFFIGLLFLAESYAFLTLFLGYLQTLWPLRRMPVPLPEDTDLWPHVDLLIPTYNEPLSVVKYTALAAINIDWPVDRLHVYVLDDGKREEFRSFCEEAGIGYITRREHLHAKAGNINHALEQLTSPFVALFDSDHVPTRSFLQLTMGWFGRDPKLAMLQTPHHFYSPDPFERNLNQFRVIPNEGELFYGVVQDGNDFWNATFFCGSCAVMRRRALDEVGGIATETVTEDAHTSLRMQMKGWNTAYINIPQAAGLATERLSSHIRQRIRWARGMVQVLRIENPLFAPGLSAAQRLCYFNAMSHFLYALPRLIFLTAPLIYLVFGYVNIPGYWAAIVAYAVPHLLVSSLANSRVQGQHRHSFWNEIYETVLAPYIFLPTMLAFVYPKFGRFQVTAKGGVVKRSFFDSRVAKPFLLLLLLNGVGLLCAVPRLLQFPRGSGHGGLLDAALSVPANMYDGTHPGTIWMNVMWAVFNLTVLGVATAVARESQQRRQTVRVSMTVPATVMLPHGTLLRGATTDVSSGGVMIRSDQPLRVKQGDPVRLIFPVLSDEATLPATVVAVDGTVLRAHFDHLTLAQEEALTMMLYSRADTWLSWGEARESDRPLVSMWRIMRLAAHGLSASARGMLPRRKRRGSYAGVVPVLVLSLMAGGLLSAGRLHGQSAPEQQEKSPVSVSAPVRMKAADRVRPAGHAPSSTGNAVASDAQFKNVITLRDAHAPDGIMLRGDSASQVISFGVPVGEAVAAATLRLRYGFSPWLQDGAGQLLVRVNGTQLAAIPAQAQAAGAMAPDAIQTMVIAVPPELIVHNNQLRLEFVAQTPGCVTGQSTAWVNVDPGTSIELAGNYRPVQNDLRMLPAPFYDAAVLADPVVPIVFLRAPSTKALQAAGIVASWMGVAADSRAIRFPVNFGDIPKGNVIVLAESAMDLPQSLNMGNSAGSAIAVRTNPTDAGSKVLLLVGGDGDELLTAARVLALEGGRFSGATATGVGLTRMPSARQPDDAPRWLPTSYNTPFGNLAQPDALQTDGSRPVELAFRLAPDLYYGDRQNLALQIAYRYNGVPLGNESSLNLYINRVFLGATPMPHAATAKADLSTVVPVAVSSLRPYANMLEGRFLFDNANGEDCQGGTPRNTQGVILKNSFLDVRGIPHWTQMPNLELFANAGYPFTRMADLSETAIVLPERPSPEIVELYLALMAHFGAQTGLPAVNVTVTNADGMSVGKDLLILSSVDDLPALGRLGGKLPVQIGQDGLRVQASTGVFQSLRGSRWWRLGPRERPDADPLPVYGGVPDAVIEGLQWQGRSVVLIALRDKGTAGRFIPAFLQSSQSSDLSHNVSVFSGGQFASYRVAADTYHVGRLPWWVWVEVFAAENPWVLIVGVILCCFVVATVLRAMLRRHARRRLEASV